jgi:uncharacterized protein
MIEELPLLQLFTRLQEAGLPLGLDDYQVALRALQSGYGVGDRAALERLCRTLWVRSSDEQQLFDYYFDRFICSEVILGDHRKVIVENLQRSKLGRTAIYWAIAIFLSLVTGVAFWFNLPYQKSIRVPSPIPTTPASATQPPTVLPTSKTPISPTPTTSASATQPPTVLPTPVSPNPQVTNWSKKQPAWLLWSLLLVVSAATTLLLVYFIQRRRKRSSTPAKKFTSESSARLTSELLHKMGDAVQVAQVVQQMIRPRESRLRNHFTLSAAYLPVTQRQMKQSWRHLRRMVREGVATELDVDETVTQIARNGILLEPVLVPHRVNRTELMLLIDQEGSMTAFHSLSAQLVETAVRGGRLGRAGVYYFHNCPVNYLYHDPMHLVSEPVEEVLVQLRRDRTVVLIFSDAGAARGGLNQKRVELTVAFLQQLQQQVQYITWLNPMPKTRWVGTTAAELALVVPMVEATRQGLDLAIDVLRGKNVSGLGKRSR